MGWYSAHRRRGTFLLLVLGFAALSVPATAGPEERLESIEEKQERAEEKLAAAEDEQHDLEADIEGLDEARESIEARIETLDYELAGLDSEIAEVKDDLAVAQTKLTALNEELDRLGARLERRTDLLEAKAVEAYKSGPAAAMDSLLSATSMADLVDRVEYYEASLDAEATLIEEIAALEAQTDEKRDEVQKRKDAIAAQQLELEEDRAEVAAVREERAGVLEEKESVIAAKETLLADAEQREVQLQEWIEQLEADSQEIEAILAAQAAAAEAEAEAPTHTGAPPSGTPPAGGGELSWPTSGPLTSPYGYRVHPIFGDTRLHSGIDIGAPYGAGVFAAGDGRISYVGAMSGYGNVIVIDHGGGIATTYNHLSAFYVSSGQAVSRGAQIGAVGCSGYCTGPHLHFEVRVNGAPVDPMPYLQ
ncbi:MAG: peptidoglycan DD-metalloendopeptidase family protein [Actinomycetota bacterium]|nr:peptidoglycan DD-metalloendopeptidase family protein [Actinomycetota bacterium]